MSRKQRGLKKIKILRNILISTVALGFCKGYIMEKCGFHTLPFKDIWTHWAHNKIKVAVLYESTGGKK